MLSGQSNLRQMQSAEDTSTHSTQISSSQTLYLGEDPLDDAGPNGVLFTLLIRN